MNPRTLFLLLVASSLHAGAHAQMFKCKGADGQVSFQGVPCTAGTTDMNPPPRPAATEANPVLPRRDSKPGANWDTGPRPATPSLPSPVATPAPSNPPAPPAAPRVAREPRQSPQAAELERQQAEQRSAEDAKAAAFNRMQRCNHARQQLGVARTERPIYWYDNKGERQYVSDANRAATTAAAEKRVAEECN